MIVEGGGTVQFYLYVQCVWAFMEEKAPKVCLMMTLNDNKLQLWQVTKVPSRDSCKLVMNESSKTVWYAKYLFAATITNLSLLLLHNFSLYIYNQHIL